jgi:hypothetical protein
MFIAGQQYTDIADGYRTIKRLESNLAERWSRAQALANNPTEALRSPQTRLVADRLTAWQRERETLERESEIRLQEWNVAQKAREQEYQTSKGEWEDRSISLRKTAMRQGCLILLSLSALLIVPFRYLIALFWGGPSMFL